MMHWLMEPFRLGLFGVDAANSELFAGLETTEGENIDDEGGCLQR